MNGIIYLLDQAGVALAQANEEIARLHVEIATLRQQIEDQQPPANGA